LEGTDPDLARFGFVLPEKRHVMTSPESTAHMERELRYEADERLDLESLGGERLETRTFTSVYYDTQDLRLGSAGVTLRRRLERGANVWQLKAPSGEARLELEAAGGPGGPPAPLEMLLRPQQGDERLVELATLETIRSGVLVDGAAVTLDQVQVMEGGRVLSRFAEVEAEVVSPEGDLRRVDRLLTKAGARRSAQTPKIWRVLDQPRPLRLPSRKASTLTHLQARFQELRTELLAADVGLRIRDDAEDVHRMRVATRRSRATLRAGRKVFDRDWAESLRRELEYLGDALGAVRDLDVLVAHLDDAARALDRGDAVTVAPLLQMLRERRKSARESLAAVLDGERYFELLRSLERASSSPPVANPDIRLEPLARKEFKRLCKAARSLRRDASDGELHKLRIRGKRARYTAELAQPLRGKPAKRFVKRAKRLQDLLGEHQDAVVAEQEIRELARRLPDHAASLAAGRLVSAQRLRRSGARDRLRSELKRVADSGRKAWK
jgi:CHAD domain-containing protein